MLKIVKIGGYVKPTASQTWDIFRDRCTCNHASPMTLGKPFVVRKICLTQLHGLPKYFHDSFPKFS